MIEHNAQGARHYIPESAHARMSAAHVPSVMENEMFRLLRYELIKCSPDDLRQIYCMGEGLENKLKKEIVSADSMKVLLDNVVSKRYTEAAIRRLLLYVLMGIKGPDHLTGVYARILAAGEQGRKLLRQLKKDKSLQIPVINNINKDIEEVSQAGEMLKYDCRASDIYNLISGRSLYHFSDRVVHPHIEAER